uniref:Uncharacterized protein n=1 Tax=Denticeps clupeoides TaxID=299321 RepID=A0AAY4DPD0_9TELE
MRIPGVLLCVYFQIIFSGVHRPFPYIYTINIFQTYKTDLSSPVLTLACLCLNSPGQTLQATSAEKRPTALGGPFSPVIEVRHNGMSNARALEDLLDLTGHVAYPKLSPVANMGDCNKNLIEGLCSPSSDSQLLQTVPPSSHKLNIQ